MRWNKALARVAEIEAKIAGHAAAVPSRAEAAPLTFTNLAGDLRAVWTAPTTDARLKKRIVRTVIHEVMAISTPMQPGSFCSSIGLAGSTPRYACPGGGAGNAPAPRPM
jgi:hypothetical protein